MTTIELTKLTQWDGNVRKTNTDADIEELVASIKAHGLLNPLTVKGPGARGRYEVVAGQRRLKALLLLASRRDIPARHGVECTVLADDADLTEISLAENVVRTQMHPADQYEAFRAMVEAGASVIDIAARFGVSEATVAKRLKLGRVHPDLLALYREGKIGLEHVQAFTVTDDQAEQLRVWRSLPNWSSGPSGIRAALSKNEIAATDKRVQFVGMENYEAAGGEVRRDLFDDRNAGWVKDVALLDQMVAARLEGMADEVRAEGWKWVEVRGSFGWDDRRAFTQDHGQLVEMTAAESEEWDRLSEEYGRIEEKESEEGDLSDEDASRAKEIDARLDVLRDRPHEFAPEIKALAGAVIHLGYHGVEIERGLIRREDAPRGEAAAALGLPSAPPAVEKSAFSAALVVDLKTEKTGAIQAELALDPKIALAALVHALAGRRFIDSYFGGDNTLKASVEQQTVTSGSKAKAALEKVGAKWKKKLPQDRAALWTWCLKAKQDTLLDLLAYLVARSADGHARHADDLVDALGVDLRTWFTPDAENYFGRVSKEQIIADMAEMGVEGDASFKKPVLAKEAAGAAQNIGAGWLPEPMRRKAVAVAAVEEDFDQELDEAA